MLSCIHQHAPHARAMVIALHGLGATADNLQPLAHQFQSADGGIGFIFPQAPTRPVTINAGQAMPAWYDIFSLSGLDDFDHSAMLESIEEIHQIIDAQVQQGFEPEKIALLGFSQGGAVAILAALSYPKPLGALCALSTLIQCPKGFESRIQPHAQHMPIFQAHGEWDPVLPMVIGQHARRQLNEWGCQVNWHEYPMGHDICPEEVVAIKQVLHEALLKPKAVSE